MDDKVLDKEETKKEPESLSPEFFKHAENMGNAIVETSRREKFWEKMIRGV